MNKCLTLLLSGVLAAGLMTQTAAAPRGQARFVPFEGQKTTGAARSTSLAETREFGADYATRRLQTAPIAGKPASMRVAAPENTAAKAPLARVSASLNLYGTVIFNNTWTDYKKLGVYKVPVVAGAAFEMLYVTPDPVYAYYDGEGLYYSLHEVKYGTWVMGYDLYVYDTATNELVRTIELDDLPLKATDVAYDPINKRAYGCFSGEYYDEVYRFWGYLDVKAGQAVKIADMDFSLRGVAIDKRGNAYGIDLEGNLYKIDKNAGTFELVGNTNCPSLSHMSSAAYNDKDGSIILSFCNEEKAGLVEINPATAESKILTEFAEEEEVIGLYMPAQAPDDAPAAPVMTVSCAEGSMTADITLVMPTKLYSGADAPGTIMSYGIFSDGTSVAAGMANPGATVKKSVVMTESGMHTFTAVAVNKAGESNQAKQECYIGKGTPAATSGVVLKYADGSFILTWEPVTASSDNGYLNAADVRYDIVDSEGATVATDLAECQWTKAQAAPEVITAYSFGVVAKYAGKTSKAVMSNAINLGHYVAPCSMNMADKTTFGRHTVLDANNDGKTWNFSSKNGTRYSYGSNDADDWLFSPAIYLEAGKAYDFAAIAHAYSDKYPEKLEIKMGKAPSADAMGTTLVGTTVLGGANSNMTAAVAPDESAEYYIGFHAVSDGGQWDLTLVSYSLSEPYSATAPDAVENLKVVPAISGDLNATVSFTTSAVTVTGKPYSGDMKIAVLRNGEKVKEITAAAGTEQSFTDVVPEAARYTYTVEAYNADGEKGRSASASSFVGPNVPNPPAAVKAVETAGKYGEVTLSWEHAATDVDNNPLLPANLTYNVYLYDNTEKKWSKVNTEPVAQLSYTFTIQAETDPQTFAQVGVQTVNRGVVGEELQGAGFVAVGPAYSLPMALSSVSDVQNYILGIDDWDGCEFGMKTDADMNSVVSQDGDGQFFYGERVGSSTELGTGKGRGDLVFGKVNLAGANYPVFSMYTWKITETDKTKLELFVICDGETELAATIDYAADTHNQWTKKTVSLEKYKGKTVQSVIRYHSDGLVYCFFDNIKVYDLPDYDLGAVSVSAPKEVEAGEDFNVDAVVENVGRFDATSFSVELMADGKTVATKTVDALAAGARTTVAFAQQLNMSSGKTVEYSARVVFGSDSDLSNNVTAKTATVKRTESILPAVANVGATASTAGNVITWDAITDADIPYDAFVESFENADAFSKAYEGWTFIDRDKLPAGGLGDMVIPNHTAEVDPESFIVIDGTHEVFASSNYAKEYVAADGNQYLGSIYVLEGDKQLGTCDDWAVSPLLKGIGQTVSFKGKNASINYSELIQVWYATEDTTDPDKFVQLNSFNNSGSNSRTVRTDGWGEFAFELPEGALRFAIRVVSNDGMMFMLDEVEYLAADAAKGLELAGYNVYCNGELITPAPVAVNTFTHTGADNSIDNVYHVTAVYNRGESEARSATVKTSGIENIGAAAEISVVDSRIIVTGAGEAFVTIAATDGKVLSAAPGDASVYAAPGIYLVQIGNKTTKVIVR